MPKNRSKTTWEVERLLDKRTQGPNCQYLVKWENSWIDEKTLLKMLRQHVKRVLEKRITATAADYLVEWDDTWVNVEDVSQDMVDAYELVHDQVQPQDAFDDWGDYGGHEDGQYPAADQVYEDEQDLPVNQDAEEEPQADLQQVNVPLVAPDRFLSIDDIRELLVGINPSIQDIDNWKDFSHSLRDAKLRNIVNSGVPVPYIVKNRVTQAQKFICPACFNTRNKSSYYRQHDCLTHALRPAPSDEIKNKFGR